MLSDCHAHLHHVIPDFRRPKRTVDAAMSTTFVCLENPYEVPTSTLCWSTSQIVELAPNLPSIKLTLSGHVSGSLDAGNHINTKLGFLKHLDMEYGTVWKVEVEYAPLHKNYGLGLTTWSPLTTAVLSGKCSKGNIPEGNHFALENYKVESCKPVTYGMTF